MTVTLYEYNRAEHRLQGSLWSVVRGDGWGRGLLGQRLDLKTNAVVVVEGSCRAA
jgi:hypothetical protein